MEYSKEIDLIRKSIIENMIKRYDFFSSGNISLIKENLEEMFSKAKQEVIDNIDSIKYQKGIYTKEEYYEIIKNRVRVTKKRWVSTDLKSGRAYNELEAYKVIYNHPVKLLKDKADIKYDSYNDFAHEFKANLKRWTEDENLPLLTYEYFTDKNKKSRNSAIISEIQIEILKQIINNDKGVLPNKINNTEVINESKKINLDNHMEIIPDKIVNSPINTSEKPISLIKNKEIKANIETQGYITEYFIEEKSIDGTLMINQFGKAAIEKAKSVLSSTDLKVVAYILKNRDSNFFETGKVVLPLQKMCSDIFKCVNNEKRTIIKSSIVKMANIKINVYDKTNNNRWLVTSLLSEAMLDEIDKKDVIIVYVSATYRNELIANNVVKVYSNIIEKCNKNEDAIRELFHLQKERLVIHEAYKNDEKLMDDVKITFIGDKECFVKKVHYEFFKESIIFLNKKTYKIKERIDKFLTIIKDTNSILESFIREGDYYYLIFSQLQPSELMDIEKSLMVTKTL